MVEHILAWIQAILSAYPLAAPLAFVIAHTLLAVFLLPCSPMTLMAGMLWGGVYGVSMSMCGALVASSTTFLLSRSFLRGKIESFLIRRYPKVESLLAQAVVHDWKLIAATQLNPLIPSSAMGYVFGLSRISFVRYFLFSGIFMLPLSVLFVMTGYSAAYLLTTGKHWKEALALIISVAFAPLVIKLVYRKVCLLFGVKNGS